MLNDIPFSIHKKNRPMKQDLDISNIESKPTVVLVSNQSEYDQLMQHLEKEGFVWNGNTGEKPTEWRPSGFLPPYIINIYPDKKITWGLESNETPLPFPEYAAKHIKPTDSNPFQKGDAVRLKQSDECYPKGTMFIVDGLIGNSMVIVFRGIHGIMASVDKYEKTTASAKTLRKIRKRLVSFDETCSMHIQPTGNTGKPKRPYPNRVVKSKYDAVVAERDRLQALSDTLAQEVDYAHSANNTAWAKADEFKALYLQADERALTAAEKLARLDTLARKLRDQRDTARFLAALFFLASAGFAVAVLVGRLVPVV